MKLIGITGLAGSGKDTAAAYIESVCDRSYNIEYYSFAKPLKDLVKHVFGFSNEQLYGPSKMRNTADHRLSMPTFRTPVIGGLLTRMMRSLRGAAVLENRADARIRFITSARGWLDDVLPPEVKSDLKRYGEAYSLLELWMEDVLEQDVVTPRYALQTLGTEYGRSIDPLIWVKYVIRQVREFDLAERRSEYGRPDDHIHVVTDVRFINEAEGVLAAGGEVWKVDRRGVQPLKAGIQSHRSETEMDSAEWTRLITRTLDNNKALVDLKLQVAIALNAFEEQRKRKLAA